MTTDQLKRVAIIKQVCEAELKAPTDPHEFAAWLRRQADYLDGEVPALPEPTTLTMVQ
jgi:hypothetical protein